MQIDFILEKKVEYKPFDPTPRVGRGRLRIKYLLPCCCMFDMQNDHILLKFNFDLLTKPQGSGGGVCG